MNKFVLPSLSKAINAYLQLDPESNARLQHLQGKAIAIELRPFRFTFQCVFSATGVTLHADDTIETNATLRGTPLQMLGIMMNKENRQKFFADDLVIEGNAAFGNEVVELFDEMQIDWEEHLSRFTGDVSAYHVTSFMKKVGNWFRNLDESLTDDVDEYLHEEAQWLPAREALQDFFHEIDNTRMDVDRMEARINHLRASIANEEESQ